MIRTAILTVNDAEGGTDGNGGPRNEAVDAVRELLASGPFAEVDRLTVPGEQAIIRAKLRVWADGGETDLVLTVGGIGLALRDRAPEATAEVIEREVPGLAELMRIACIRRNRRAALSRAVAGVRRSCLIVNLPDDPGGAREAFGAVIGVLPHAIDAIADRDPAGPAGAATDAPSDWTN